MATPGDRERRRWAVDIALSALAIGVLLVVSRHVPAGPGTHPLDPLGYTLLVLAGASVGLCRRWPRTATAAVTVVLCVFVVRPYPNGPVWVTGLIALVVLAWRTDRRSGVIGAVVMMTALTAAAVSVGYDGILLSAVYVGWSAAAVFGGDLLRTRTEHLATQRERARFLEQHREEETARRIAEERLRIARDLHDSVAHAIATITVQAGAAAHVLDRRPEVAGAALTAIQRASAQVLEELTAMLTVLREDGQTADRIPVPGLWDIERLVQGAATPGVQVTLSLDAPRHELSPRISTAAYRVVQESLTNVMRHSMARTARVQVVARPGAAVTVQVSDDGPRRAGETAGTGVGLRGMQERVTSTGGRFEAGPEPAGGFAVHATWVRPT